MPCISKEILIALERQKMGKATSGLKGCRLPNN